jgi:hypothetical protein
MEEKAASFSGEIKLAKCFHNPGRTRTEQDVAQTEASGFTAHLTKPVRIELLEKALTVALNKQNAP